MLFDWLVTGHVIDDEPGPRGARPEIRRQERQDAGAGDATRRAQLLDSIDVTTLIGLRDRALIGVMVYTFARVNAVLGMKVKDYYTQGRRGWVRLHEKGGKEHEVPCHHTLEQYLDEYIAAAGIAGEPDGFAIPHDRPQDRRGRAHVAAGRLPDDPAPGAKAGLKTRVGNHTFRATGITAYLEEQRPAGARADDRQPLLAAHDEALRPPLRRDLARRGGEDFDLKDALNAQMHLLPR